MRRALVGLLLLCLLAPACAKRKVEGRTINIYGSMSGATLWIRARTPGYVALDEDDPSPLPPQQLVEIGRLPMRQVFLSYGTYDLQAVAVHGLTRYRGDASNLAVDRSTESMSIALAPDGLDPGRTALLTLVTVALMLGLAIALRRRSAPVEVTHTVVVDRHGELPAGTPLKDYTIVGMIARGGMGSVYEVEDRYGDRFAMKVPDWKLQEGEKRLRFMREIEICRQLNHPNVVRLFDFCPGDADTPMFMVLELVDGTSLSDLIRARPLEVADAVELAQGVLAGLGHGHSRGVVHRDVKAANILVTQDRVPKLSDWGIARNPDMETITAANEAMGTPAWMAPEQLRSHKVDHRADLYAVGVLLFRTITGRMPFEVTDPLELIYKKWSEDAPTPRTGVEALDALIARALARNPDDRPQSAREFAELLASITAAPPSP